MKSSRPTSPFSLMPLVAIALVLLAVAIAKPARAAGLLIADGGFGGVLELKEHEVQVTINNGIAVTEVTQIFHNTENRQVEALYTFPVPKQASVSNFSMWINGKEMIGEVLEKERARKIYNSYKQRRRDPGLLEQVDYKRFEMRIFPIAPNADQKVQIIYYQELDVDHDDVTYVYPLATVTRNALDSRTTGKPCAAKPCRVSDRNPCWQRLHRYLRLDPSRPQALRLNPSNRHSNLQRRQPPVAAKAATSISTSAPARSVPSLWGWP